jgi:hypothetical protein
MKSKNSHPPKDDYFLILSIENDEGFEGYFKNANDFAFLKTQALKENFLCVLARKFG